MQIEVIVEEFSMEQALRRLIPEVRPDIYFEIRNFNGKGKLLKRLPALFRAYAGRARNQSDLRVMVLIDNDGGDCAALKTRLEDMARDAGLLTKSEAGGGGGNFTAVNRIVMQELESWFLGDPQALRQAFKRLPRSFEKRKAYRNPEQDKASEALQRLLDEHGYYEGVKRLPKHTVADLVAPYMSIDDVNSAPSFKAFIKGLRACV